jgi:O-antigen/teichoic acid export membrane protein
VSALENPQAQASAHMTPGRLPLRARILNAGSWSMVGHFAGQALRLASSLVMTRLLVPEMFGVMAIALMVHMIIALLSDIGLRQTIVQSHRGDSRALLDTAFTVQAVRGGLIWGACLLVAVGFQFANAAGLVVPGTVYASPELPAVLAASSFSAVIMGFQSTKVSTTQRHLDFKRATQMELAAQIVGLVASALLGWLTRSIWSFVVGSLLNSIVLVVLSHTWLRGENNRFQWDRAAVSELLGYGRWVLLSSTLYVLALNADRIFLGAWVSAVTLGLYSIALNLALMVDGAGSRLFSSVTMAALSEVARNEPHRFSAVYRRMRLPFDVAFVGSAGFLFAAGPTIVDVLYDPRYAEAGQMLQVLSFSLVFARFGLTGSAYLALGEPQKLTWVHVVKLVSVFVLIPLLYKLYGFQGALFAIAFHAVPTLPLMYWFNRKWQLDDVRLELLALLSWPAGWLCGRIASWIF